MLVGWYRVLRVLEELKKTYGARGLGLGNGFRD